jgi:hypothetical protein
MTWPVAPRLSTHLIGYGDDMWVHYWNDWWVKHVLQHGGEFFYTPLLFHPSGVDLTYHNFAWVNIASWLILEPFTGGIAAYNLVHLLHIPLCGFSMFLLVRRLTQVNGVAFLSGLIFAFWPYRVLDVTHPNMISTEGFPLLMLALLRLFDDKRPIRDGVIVGLLVALIGFMRLQLTILAGIMMGGYFLYMFIWERERWGRQVVIGLMLAGVVSVTLLLPIVYPLARQQLTDGFAEQVYQVDVDDTKQDVLSWLIPHATHPLAGLVDRIFVPYTTKPARSIFSAYVGYVAAGLAILGVLKRRGQRRVVFWLGLGIVSFFLALGPYLNVDLIRTGIPLPYKLVEWLPPIQMVRHPHRFSALLAVPMAVLAGQGALALREWLMQRNLKFFTSPVIWGLLAVGVLADYWSAPLPTVTAAIPDFYVALAQEPREFAVVGLPGNRGCTEQYMFYQTAHEHPILGGHVSRLPTEALAFEDSVPLLDGMYDSGEIDMQLPDISRQLSLLDEAGFRYLVLHKHLVWPGTLAKWRSYFAISPYYEDEDVVVYTTDPVLNEDYALEYELGLGMGLVDVDLSTDSVRPGDVLELTVLWGTSIAPDADFRLELALENKDGVVAQMERLDLSPSWPTGAWSANAIVRDRYSLKVDTWLDGGTYGVVLNLLQEGKPVGQRTEVGEIDLQLPERVFVTPTMSHQVGATFGNDLRLLGYDLRMETDALYITLHWQALRRMEKSYVMFVHLLDPETQEIVAQVDAMPYGYTYPTAWWEKGEVVSDELVLPLEGEKAITCKLTVGAYDHETGTRLLVRDASGALQPEERLVLLENVQCKE